VTTSQNVYLWLLLCGLRGFSLPSSRGFCGYMLRLDFSLASGTSASFAICARLLLRLVRLLDSFDVCGVNVSVE
jgi:hypothetical protein